MEEFFSLHYPDSLGPESKAEFHRKQLTVLEQFVSVESVNAWTGIYAYKLLVLSACLFGAQDYEEGWRIFEQAIMQYKLWYSIAGHILLDTGFGGIRVNKDRNYAVLPDGTKEFIGDCIYPEGNMLPEYLHRRLTNEDNWEWFNSVRNDQRFVEASEIIKNYMA